MSVSQVRNTVRLGAAGPEVFPIALGCMAMSGVYGHTSEEEAAATIQAAIDSGVNLIDTGDFYGMGHNEMLVGRAIRARRDKALVSVKFGALRSPDGAFIGFDSRPSLVKTFAAYSLQRLGVEVLDIYRPSRLDPNIPIEDTIGAISDLVKAGYVRYIGLSEVGAESIRRAHAVHPIVDLQIEYSLVSRGPEQNIFPVLEELGIGATLYGVLSRGLLSGSKPGAPGDLRAAGFPRFASENFSQNEAAVVRFAGLAADSGRTAAQLALAWVLAKQPRLVPLAGPRTRTQLADLLAVLDRPLTPAEVQEVEAALPAAAISGTRYQAAQMTHLDSEK